MQNWRPLALLNTDFKIFAKVIAQRLNEFLVFLISSNQSVYVDGQFISEGGSLISDFLEINDTLKLNGLLVTIDIQKSFKSS